MGKSLKERISPEYIAPYGREEIYLYRVGGLSMSVCAPGDLPPELVAEEVDKHYPCGTSGGWLVSQDKTFGDGSPNPCKCQEDASRKHWFLEA